MKISPDRYLLVFFVVGLCCLSFVSGAFVAYYKTPGSGFLFAAFDGGEAWYERWQEYQDSEEMHSVPTPLKGEVTIHREGMYEGYTLICNYYSTTVHLIDSAGKIVHRWNLPFEKAWPEPKHINKIARAVVTITTAQVFPNGDLLVLYTGVGDSPYGYGMVKADKDSNILWTYSDNTHHDFYVDKHNGNIYTLVQEARANPFFPQRKIIADIVVILSPQGKEISRIPLMEAFSRSAYKSVIEKELRKEKDWDVMHSNGIRKIEPEMAAHFPMFKAGQVLLSLHKTSSLAVLDVEKKKIVWVKNQAGWKKQHAPRLMENGQIALLDNKGAGKNQSRVVEFDPVTLKVKTIFPVPFYSKIMGRIEPLPNGNMLIASAMEGRAMEVTAAGKIVWEYQIDRPHADDDATAADGRRFSRNFIKEMNGALVTANRYPEEALPFLSNSAAH